MSRLASGSYSRLQFLRAVSHSVGAHTEAPQPRDDSSSSEDEDEDEASQTPAATTSAASESATAAAASTSDDCSQVCLVAPRAGFALVPCGHARFCESCAIRVSDMVAGCPVFHADIAMAMSIFYARQLYRQVLLRVHISYGNSVCPSVCLSVPFVSTEPDSVSQYHS